MDVDEDGLMNVLSIEGTRCEVDKFVVCCECERWMSSESFTEFVRVVAR